MLTHQIGSCRGLRDSSRQSVEHPNCSTHPYNGVVEKKTGKRGLLFRVRSIKWLSDIEVQVVGGYFEDGLSASGNTYTVVRTRDKWMVNSAGTNWIS